MKRLKDFFELVSSAEFWRVMLVMVFLVILFLAGAFVGIVKFMAYWKIAFGK